MWSNTGALLGSANFIAETASGWQEASFDAPIPINANTTYVASYFTPTGNYAVLAPNFTSTVDNAPLHALRDGLDGSNGVYIYSATSAFPTNTFNSTNYAVDVTLITDNGPDTTPPVVLTRAPTSGSAAVAVGTNVQATFNENLDSATVDTSSFFLRGPGNTAVAANVTYDSASRTAILTPTLNLAYSTVYTATLTTDITDIAGNTLQANSVWSFTTATLPPPPADEGPGGPILVVTSAGDRFGRYLAQILQAEGLNAYRATDVSNLSAAMLATYDVVLVAPMSLSAAQVTLLTNFVNAGGNLIAFKPDPSLFSLLGITAATGTTSGGYVLIDTSKAPGAGIVSDTMQFHTSANHYNLSGATTLATLYSTANAATPFPAATLRNVGTNGGQAASFSYDLARSVVYTRQGNPLWAGQKRDGQINPIRSDDQFFPDWIDFSKVQIPQADEQQRFLTNLISLMNFDKKPLPKFWYLPNDKKAVVVMTGDDHAGGGTAGRFDAYIAASTPGCNVANWECIRATSYVFPGTAFATPPTTYDAQGFEIALHLSTNCQDYTSQLGQPNTLNDFFDTQLAQFQAAYPGLPNPRTNRTHCIAWSDWAGTPKAELAHSIRLDTNYYYWPQSWILDRPGLFTGSGMPMRFADLDGSIIDVYQAATQMTDESGQSYPLHINTLLNNALSAKGYYGVFTANMHTDAVSSPGSDAIIAAAKANNVSVVSARQMLAWLDSRNTSSFSAITRSGNTLAFNVSQGSGENGSANGLRAMLPLTSSLGSLTGVTRNGVTLALTNQTIKGIDYAFFDAQNGNYVATYQGTSAPLTVTAPSATITYGQTPPALAPTYTGFVNGDTASDLDTQATCSTTATATSAAGSYPVTCSGAADSDYTFNYVAGTLTIQRANLTVTASSASIIVGDTPPAITASYSGFANGESAASLTTQATCSTTATSSSPVGTYPSNCGGAASPNYAFTYVSGAVTVNPSTQSAPAFTSVPNATFTVGEPNSFNVSATGNPAVTFVITNGSLPSGLSLSSTGILSGTPVQGSDGTYGLVITAQNGVAPDASQAFTLTVNASTIGIAPSFTSTNSATFTVGSAATFNLRATGTPAPTFALSSGTLPSGITLTPSGTLSGTPAAGSHGTYALVFSASNGVVPNAMQNFTLVVNPASTGGGGNNNGGSGAGGCNAAGENGSPELSILMLLACALALKRLRKARS